MKTGSFAVVMFCEGTKVDEVFAATYAWVDVVDEHYKGKVRTVSDLMGGQALIQCDRDGAGVPVCDVVDIVDDELLSKNWLAEIHEEYLQMIGGTP